MDLQARPSALLNPIEEPGWNDLIKSHSQASFFHTAEWARTLHDSYGHRPLYFVQRENGVLNGLIGVMEISSLLTGKRGVSLPFTDACPPLSSGSNSCLAQFREVVKYGGENGWKSFELRGDVNAPMNACTDGAFYMHEIELGCGKERVFQSCKASVRTAIRKAEAAGVQVEISHSVEGVKTFYQLHCQTRAKHGAPPQPFMFFKNICKHVFGAGLGFVAIAKVEQRPIAAAVIFHFEKSAIYKYGASDAHYQSLRPTNLIFAEVIKRYCGEGYKFLSLGRTSLDNDGLRRFKLGWGGVEQTLAYCKYDLRQNCYSTSKDRTKGWHTALFSMMPSSLSRVCGALLYKHIS